MARAVVCITPPFGKIKPLSDLVVFSDVKSYIPQWDTPDYLNACRKYAIEHKVYLVPSRFVVDNILYLCLFSPKGDILGIQGATHRNLYNQSTLRSMTGSNRLRPPSATSFCASMWTSTTRRWSASPAMKGRADRHLFPVHRLLPAQPPHADHRHLERGAVQRALCGGLLQLLFGGGRPCDLTGRRERLSGAAGKLAQPVRKVVSQ